MSDKRIKAVINKTAVKENLLNLYNVMDVPVPIMCVIKADGYGHGALELASIYEEMNEVCGYATATAEEALSLRNAGIKKRILILGATFEDDYDELIKNNIDLTVFSYDAASIMNEHARKLGLTANVHIKTDTGMSRIGLTPDEAGCEIVCRINELENINIIGLFTHFAKADETDKTSAYNQLNRYKKLLSLINEKGIDVPIRHCSNSAALLELKEARFDMVRAGIVLYGLWPSNEIIKENVTLKPVMSLISHIVYVKEISKGTQISYGGTFEAAQRMRIATIPVGYADGYPRMQSNKGRVIINGQYAPILGRVCMDQMMVDITNIPDAVIGSEVILMGASGNAAITAEEIGDISGRFNYELVCDITKRVPRVYID